MKANELRLGGYICRRDLVSEEERIEQIIELQENKAVCSGPFKVISLYVDLKPIPLTEEWLLKFGFRQTNESEDIEWYNLDGFEIAIHEEDGDVYFVYQHMVLRHILYVHQLQNLYFALTGEELLITCK